MGSDRLSHAARLNDEVRSSLTRIQLAASELARSTSTPRDGALVARIGRAVVELDGLNRALESVLRPRSVDGRKVDLVPILQDVHERLAPAVAARGLVWGPLDRPASAVIGNPSSARHAAIALLRAASSSLASEVELRLGLAVEAERYGVLLEIQTSGEPLRAEQIVQGTSEAQGLALSRGGDLEVSVEGASARLAIWWYERGDA